MTAFPSLPRRDRRRAIEAQLKDYMRKLDKVMTLPPSSLGEAERDRQAHSMAVYEQLIAEQFREMTGFYRRSSPSRLAFQMAAWALTKLAEDWLSVKRTEEATRAEAGRLLDAVGEARARRHLQSLSGEPS